MKKLYSIISRAFSGKPTRKYRCPTCKIGSLVPQKDSFDVIEPKHSKVEHSHDAWDPEWITYRFAFKCQCDTVSCGEVAWATGNGSVDQRYDEEYDTEYYDRFFIRTFYPAPYLTSIPANTPNSVSRLLEKSFKLYWVDTSAASNALRASLEALLDDLKLPRKQADKKGKMQRIPLHTRLETWAVKQPDNAELCLVLKEVGNLGSHGDNVEDDHYFGSLAIYSHVLSQLYENNSEKMKQLATNIKQAIKGKKD